MESSATIAIIGKPNVGKSTLFNRLIGKKHAITTDIAGTTRDILYQNFKLEEYNLLLIDTGGIEYDKKENIEADIQSQAHVAINDADIIIFMLDISSELSANDYAAVEILRKSKKPIILIANKCDNVNLEENIYNMYELGLGEPIKISAIHKTGIDRLQREIIKKLKELKITKTKKTKEPSLNIAILGKPNAGKSSLINAIAGEKKAIVSEIPGTTRDTIDIVIKYKDQKIKLIDTAGLKKRGQIKKGLEKFSSLRCINAIEKANIIILLIDGETGVTAQDAHIAQYALEGNKGIILTINKSDLINNEQENLLMNKIKRKFAFIPWAPLIFISAKDEKNINHLLELAVQIQKEGSKRINTAEVNDFLQTCALKHSPSSKTGKTPKFMYASQVDTSPPKFVIFFKNASNLHFSYPRYLENEIRKKYGFEGSAINIKIKENPNKAKKLQK